MQFNDLLTDCFLRIRDDVQGVLDGLDPPDLQYRPDSEANTIAWVLWHLTRIQDDHVAELAGIEQVWTAEGWAARFGLPFDVSATGYGQTSADVAAVSVGSDLLGGYHDAVHGMTAGFLSAVREPDLDRVVDERWDPPVTMGVRLVSVIEDGLQHVGQAAYLKGLAKRSGSR